jgi:hypothetical protein
VIEGATDNIQERYMFPHPSNIPQISAAKAATLHRELGNIEEYSPVHQINEDMLNFGDWHDGSKGMKITNKLSCWLMIIL